MSEESVEIVRTMYRPGDPSRFFELLDQAAQLDAAKQPLLPGYPN
jgi:hypothetical protein